MNWGQFFAGVWTLLITVMFFMSVAKQEPVAIILSAFFIVVTTFLIGEIIGEAKQ